MKDINHQTGLCVGTIALVSTIRQSILTTEVSAWISAKSADICSGVRPNESGDVVDMRTYYACKRRAREKDHTRRDMVSLFPEPGPSLPHFKTLAITGFFHASAPIHLCLSHIGNAPTSRAVILTPARDKLKIGLEEYNDECLFLRSEYGRINALSSRIAVQSVLQSIL